MKTLLQLNASLFSEQGQSSQLSNAFVDAWRASHPDGRVVTRDLGREPVPHLDAATFKAFSTPAAERSAEQRLAVAYSDSLIEELRAADVIVIGLPLYNFGVPSALKAYFDHVARSGVTFKYGANGPVGLLTGKKVYVMAARGGVYAGTAKDTQTAYVRDFLAFIGLGDIEFVYAEGLAMGERRAQSLSNAQGAIDRLAA